MALDPTFSIPNSILYVPLLLLAAYFAFRALADVYILVHFGQNGGTLRSVLLLFFAGTAVIFGGMMYALSGYDLARPIPLPALSNLLSPSVQSYPSLLPPAAAKPSLK